MKSFLYKAWTVLILTVSAAQAVSVGGIELPPVRDGLTLQGAGLLRKGWFFKIYVGALYTAGEVDPEEILSNIPKRIDIHYLQNIPRKHMIQAAENTLRKNLSEARYREIVPQMNKLHDAYRDGKRGSFASLVHTPGSGLTYLFDNRPVITIECDDFANDYYHVWLGEEPSSRTVKEGMLGGAGDQG